MLHPSAQGYTMHQTGGKMYRTVETVKMYRSYVQQTRRVKISEAVAYAYSFNPI